MGAYPSPPIAEVRALMPDEAAAWITELAAVLVDCVAGGASVSFMAGFSQRDGEAFFQGVIQDVRDRKKLLYAAFVAERLLGTVQVILAAPPNQPHRGELAKLLVHRDARNMGLGAMLVQAAEEGAREAGKSLLILDTVEGEAGERLYTRCGWQRV